MGREKSCFEVEVIYSRRRRRREASVSRWAGVRERERGARKGNER